MQNPETTRDTIASQPNLMSIVSGQQVSSLTPKNGYPVTGTSPAVCIYLEKITASILQVRNTQVPARYEICPRSRFGTLSKTISPHPWMLPRIDCNPIPHTILEPSFKMCRCLRQSFLPPDNAKRTQSGIPARQTRGRHTEYPGGIPHHSHPSLRDTSDQYLNKTKASLSS